MRKGEKERRALLEWEASPEGRRARKQSMDTRMALAQILAVWFGMTDVPRYPFIR
jgi:hypothetical protein